MIRPFEYMDHQSEDINGADQIKVVNKNHPKKSVNTPNIFGRTISATRLTSPNPGEQPTISEKKDALLRMDGKKYLKKFDLLSLAISVVSFIVFNIFFWNVQSYHI